MGKYTQGPWAFHTEPQPNGCPTIGTNNGLMVAQISHSINHSEQRETAISNAQLISAAPDLYEALKIILEYPYGDASPLEDPLVMEQARAAIRKAEGE